MPVTKTNTYVLPFKSDHKNVVRYQDADGVNFYMPKADLPNGTPDAITLTVKPS